MKLTIITNSDGVISSGTDYTYQDPAEIAVAIAELKRIEVVLVNMWNRTI